MTRYAIAALAAAICACSASHRPDDGGAVDAGALSDAGRPAEGCVLPLSAPLEAAREPAAVAFFVDETSGECRLDCGRPSCGSLPAPWRHVLTFEVLGATENRATTSFAGVGPMESASRGDLVGDGLLERVPWDTPTEVAFRGDEEARLEFRLRRARAGAAEVVIEDFSWAR